MIEYTFKLVIFLYLKMENTYNSFSIVMPILGTEKELNLQRKQFQQQLILIRMR